MNNENLTIIFITIILLIFALSYLNLLKKSRESSRNEPPVSFLRATKFYSNPYLTRRQLQKKEKLCQLVRARVQATRFDVVEKGVSRVPSDRIAVWGGKHAKKTKYMHFFVGQPYKKIEPDRKNHCFTRTEIWTGYRFHEGG